jgi:hypothetical protein
MVLGTRKLGPFVGQDESGRRRPVALSGARA